MKICFVYKEDYPWDVRVEKICHTLRDAGHEVHLVCHNRAGRARRDVAEGLSIHRLPAASGPGAPLRRALQLPFYFSATWRRAIERCCREQGIELVIVRDLPLALMAVEAARSVGARVILDMAECYPLMYESMRAFTPGKISNRLMKNPTLAAWVERRALARIDHVFVMIEESRDRLLQMGVDPEKVSIVSNTPVDHGPDAAVGHRPDDPLRLFYVGFLTRVRGLDIAIEHLGRAVETGRDEGAQLDIVGVGDAASHLCQLIDRHGLAGRVRLHGWLEHDEVKALAAACNVGVLPYRSCPHWNHTIPNKLFDYMRNGYPVLTTGIRPISRIVREHECGVVYGEDDPASFAQALSRLSLADERERLARNGLRAVADRYNWARDAEVMLAAVDRVAG